MRKKVLTKPFAHAISGHYRDFWACLHILNWLRGSASYVIMYVKHWAESQSMLWFVGWWCTAMWLLEQPWGPLFLLLQVTESVMQHPCNLPTKDTTFLTLHWQHFYRISQRQNWWFSWPPQYRKPISGLPKKSKKMENILFLDCLLGCDNNELQLTVYRKPTHTNRFLDKSLYNPTSHKAMTKKTLKRWVQLHVNCDILDTLRDRSKYLECVFLKNNSWLYYRQNIGLLKRM